MNHKTISKVIGVSPGVAIGKAFVQRRIEWEFIEQDVSIGLANEELEKLLQGVVRAKLELEQLKRSAGQWMQEEQLAIFNAHSMILSDPVWIQEMQDLILQQHKSAVWAVKETSEAYIMRFREMNDDYMRERAVDVQDIADRLIRVLQGRPEDGYPVFDEPVILVTNELTPSQVAQMDPDNILGIVAATGGENSHAAIMARAMEVPFVVLRQAKGIHRIQTGDLLAIDGGQGQMFRNPAADVLRRMRDLQSAAIRQRDQMRVWVNVPAVTRDGEKWELHANIGSIKELELALRTGADGVGLFRTEFLFMERETLPSEEEQFEIYKEAVQLLKGKPLVIRTIDIGGDKVAPSLMLPKEQNPFLGYRAIRIALDRPDLFRTQLRAILRAGAFGPVKCLLPMISGIDELLRSKEIFAEVKEDLRIQSLLFDVDMQLGIMIELPAAVMQADDLAREADFFSIGTNDLTQYMLAVDRMNEKIAHLFKPIHPAVVRAIAHVAQAAERNQIPISVCGELAGDSTALPLWLGLGIRNLSMTATSILPLKQKLCSSERQSAVAKMPDWLRVRTADELRAQLIEFSMLKGAFER